MINHTKTEIDDFFEKELGFKRSIKINIRDDKSISIILEKSYDYVDINVVMLLKLMKFFGTSEISQDKYSSSGCETCDYGSNYTVELDINEGPSVEEVLGYKPHE